MTMIKLARSQRVKAWAQSSRAGTALATRYVAGSNVVEGVACATQLLRNKQIRASLFYLGEYVDTPELVAQNVAAKIAVATALGDAGLDVHVSVDPTQIGHQLNPAIARQNAFRIAEAIALASRSHAGSHMLMLDMEDQGVTDATLALHNDIRAAGLPVAVTLQAYLKRSANDMNSLISSGATVRLVKGAFAAGADVAYTTRREVKSNSRNLIDLMFSKDAKATGFKPIIATHDDELQHYASQRAKEQGWVKGVEYEFEMLLGVHSELAELQASNGERVRLYTPFGSDWWPHAMRRIGENPANGMLLARSLVSG
ncbi:MULTISPECIES: proline dehydrogenase family protein [Comamonadaceae]|nr:MULTISPECIES: proline dehydrogenase family protein [Comamonadaceae]MDD4942514.1 proline dehydrogenase family protein [Rhodoferax sp.]